MNSQRKKNLIETLETAVSIIGNLSWIALFIIFKNYFIVFSLILITGLIMWILEFTKAIVCGSPIVDRYKIIKNLQFWLWCLFCTGFPVLLIVCGGPRRGLTGAIIGGITGLVIFVVIQVALDAIAGPCPYKGGGCSHVGYGSGGDYYDY